MTELDVVSTTTQRLTFTLEAFGHSRQVLGARSIPGREYLRFLHPARRHPGNLTGRDSAS